MAQGPAVRVFPTAAALAKGAAEEVLHSVAPAIQERGECAIVLSGGETPRSVYRLLSSPPLSKRVAWKSLHLFFGDERMVPPESTQSNFGMVLTELISRVAIPPENVHRIRGEISPPDAAADYERQIALAFHDQAPRFDLILLGLGQDGHIASLFPGTEALDETQALVRSLFVERLNSWRVTLTFGCINRARRVVFVASGKGKASIVRQVLGANRPSRDLPASLVHPQEGEVLWLLDEEAAALIEAADGLVKEGE